MASNVNDAGSQSRKQGSTRSQKEEREISKNSSQEEHATRMDDPFATQMDHGLVMASKSFFFENFNGDKNREIHRRVLDKLRTALSEHSVEVRQNNASRAENRTFVPRDVSTLSSNNFRVKVHALLDVENIWRLTEICADEMNEELEKQRVLVHFNMNTSNAGHSRFAEVRKPNKYSTREKVQEGESIFSGESDPDIIPKSNRSGVNLPKLDINISGWMKEFLAKMPDADSTKRFARRPAARSADERPRTAPHRGRYLRSRGLLQEINGECKEEKESNILKEYPVDPLMKKRILNDTPDKPSILKPSCIRHPTMNCWLPTAYALPLESEDGADAVMTMEPPIGLWTFADDENLHMAETQKRLRNMLFSSFPDEDVSTEEVDELIEESYKKVLPPKGKSAFQLLEESCKPSDTAVMDEIVKYGLPGSKRPALANEPDPSMLILEERFHTALADAAKDVEKNRKTSQPDPTATEVQSILFSIIEHVPEELEARMLESWHQKMNADDEDAFEGDLEPIHLPPKVLAKLREIWKRLELSQLDKLDLILKYTSQRYFWRVDEAARLWESVSILVSEYETALEKFEDMLTARPRDKLADDFQNKILNSATELKKLYFLCRDATVKLHSEHGDHIAKGGNVNILEWLTTQASEAFKTHAAIVEST